MELEITPRVESEIRFDLNNPRPWSPKDPHLYMVDARLTSRDGVDDVRVCTGLRKVEVVGEEIRLNGQRLYLRGVLDQGYWPDSGLSAP